jgi:predicted nuclease of restriction endonuclease-like (RecB) superfamily
VAIEPDLAGYDAFLRALKDRVRAAQVRAALAVNRELVLLYWQMGRDILERQEREGWGAKVIDRLSRDLRREFPEMKGFSSRNLKYMRAFAQAWPDEAFVQAVLAQITWYHNITLVEKLTDPALRRWYATATIEFGWSRNVLALQIDSALHRRQGQATTNFSRTLPDSHSDLAQNLLKDPYNFDFLTLDAAAHERDLERGLLDHLRAFMLELGVGFAFLGSQHHLQVGDEDFFIDLLFYHVKLHCYVVIELKMGEFRPEYAGKLNFYLSAVDDLLRGPTDAPTIGLLLCRGSDGVVVEYALRDIQKPIGVSSFRVTDALPADLRGSLPTVEELEAALASGPDLGDGGT